jgi:hypothetical protein
MAGDDEAAGVLHVIRTETVSAINSGRFNNRFPKENTSEAAIDTFKMSIRDNSHSRLIQSGAKKFIKFRIGESGGVVGSVGIVKAVTDPNQQGALITALEERPG